MLWRLVQFRILQALFLLCRLNGVSHKSAAWNAASRLIPPWLQDPELLLKHFYDPRGPLPFLNLDDWYACLEKIDGTRKAQKLTGTDHCPVGPYFNMVRVMDVHDPAAFDRTMETVRAEDAAAIQKGRVFVFVFAAFRQDGVSWCPDCTKAFPVVDKCLEQVDDPILVRLSVPRDGYKGNPQHPYRVHKRLDLKALPQLYRWQEHGDLSTLIEAECADPKQVERLMNGS